MFSVRKVALNCSLGVEEFESKICFMTTRCCLQLKEEDREDMFSFQVCLWNKDMKEGEWRERDWQLMGQQTSDYVEDSLARVREVRAGSPLLGNSGLRTKRQRERGLRGWMGSGKWKAGRYSVVLRGTLADKLVSEL